MSQQVQINYQQIAVQCNSICEVAEEQLKALEETLTKIKPSSTVRKRLNRPNVAWQSMASKGCNGLRKWNKCLNKGEMVRK